MDSGFAYSRKAKRTVILGRLLEGKVQQGSTVRNDPVAVLGVTAKPLVMNMLH